MKKLCLLFAIICFAFASAQTQGQFQKIDSLLTFLNTNNKFMGAVAIRQNDKVVFSKAYGFAESETAKKANIDTKYKIGSITKTFTAVMIMQLIEEKKVELDTKLSKFYPQIPNAEKITIYHLLHHRTGILDYINGDTVTGKNIHRFHSREEMIQKITDYKSIFEPNLKFQYSNSNYSLLGYIIEDITKKSYSQNLNVRIVKKLGLKNTSFPKNIDVSKNESFSYIYNGENWTKVLEWNNSIAGAAGAISSTPFDLTTFFYGLFNGKLVNASSLEQMKTIEDSYGKGLIVLPFNDRKFYGHTGGIENFRGISGYNPEDQTTFSLIVNGDNYNINDIMIGILSLYYNQPYTFPNLKEFKIDPAVISKYAGNYSSKALPLKILIKEVNGKLTAQATGQGAFPLTAKSNTEFTFEVAGIQLSFEENTFILKQGGVEYPYKKE